MKVIDIASLPPSPWRNGGGVTREIARCEDDAGLIWRLSVADVGADGPFSLFPGASRILTVIEGAGLRLRHAGGVIEAAPGVPVSFSGETPIDCTQIAGPVRDFNVIFDARRARLCVARLETGEHRLRAHGRPLGLFSLHGKCRLEGAASVEQGSIVLFDEDDEPGAASIDGGGSALLVFFA
jgi:environmental stress-induced protein Ves